MRYLIVKISENNYDHILGENYAGEGYKFFTIREDEYSQNHKYKIFIYEQIRLENNLININRFAFQNQTSLKLFQFLCEIKGIGAKGAIKIINSSGGTQNLIKIIEKNDISKILQISSRYSSLIIPQISKAKNKKFIEQLSSREIHKNLKAEALWVFEEMNLEKEKCIKIMEKIDQELINKGKKKGINSMQLDEIVREVLFTVMSQK